MTILETVMALFLLLVGMLLIGNLFLSGLRYTARVEKRAIAAVVAERKMAGLRAWARTPAGNLYNYDDWSSVNGVTQADPQEANYQVKVDVTPRQTFSPNTPMEAGYAAADQRKMPRSGQQVCVSVWELGDPTQIFRLWSIVGDPGRTPDPTDPLIITPSGTVPNPIHHGGTADFSVKAFDSGHNEVQDVFFSWYVVAHDGNGSIQSQSRDGKTATFIHKITIQPPGSPAPPPTIIYADGNADVLARAVYRGTEITKTYPVVLAP